MQIFYPDTDFLHIVCQVFRHTLGQRGDQYLMVFFNLFIYFSDQVIDLSFHRAYLYFRIQQSCRTDDLLCPEQLMLLLIIGRCRRYEHHLVYMCFEFFEIEGSVVQCRGQTEAIVYQCLFSRTVSCIHAADLRNRHMRLVHDDQKIIREKVQQRHGRRSRRKSVQMSGIILDAGTESGLPEHLDIKIRPLRDPLCLDQLVFALEKLHPLLHLFFNIVAGCLDLLLRDYVMRCREDCYMVQLCVDFPCQRLHLGDPVNLISEKFDADQIVSALCRVHFHYISPDTESCTLDIHIITVVLNVDQLPEHFIPVLHHSGAQRYDQILIFVRASQSIDTGHAGHHHDIPAFRQGCCRRQTQLIDLIIDGRILGNIGIRRRYIRLRLIIIVIGDKIFHCVLWEKFLHFPVKLSRQCFVMRNDQCWLVQRLDHIRHGKGLTRTGDTQEGLELIALPETFYQFRDCLRLITGRLIFGM